MKDIIKFTREKNYKTKKELGQGACGKTVLIHDESIGTDFVCKKYCPINSEYRIKFFNRFVQEIKLLHLIYHRNIVRIFNHYLYPNHLSGYILMEYIEGKEIDVYIKENPQNINEIFIQTIEGFKYLEENGILHRDIRTQNIMVNNKHIVKIIDFGFGRIVAKDKKEISKSITLNWQAERPDEFDKSVYDFKTEIYFIGKIFEKIIKENELESFKYLSLLNKMCKKNPENRISSFDKINKKIFEEKFEEIDFNYQEEITYREFSDTLHRCISGIGHTAKYVKNLDEILTNLKQAYVKVSLEEIVPNSALIIECFLKGGYGVYQRTWFDVSKLKNFLSLTKSCSIEKRNIIFSNLFNKLDSIERSYDNDDIPF